MLMHVRIVNNAGIAAGKGRHLTSRTHEVPVEAFDQLISVNLKGVWLGCSMFFLSFPRCPV